MEQNLDFWIVTQYKRAVSKLPVALCLEFVAASVREIHNAVPYTLKFSRWINFRVFRELVCIRENKNRKNYTYVGLRTRHAT